MTMMISTGDSAMKRGSLDTTQSDNLHFELAFCDGARLLIVDPGLEHVPQRIEHKLDGAFAELTLLSQDGAEVRFVQVLEQLDHVFGKSHARECARLQSLPRRMRQSQWFGFARQRGRSIGTDRLVTETAAPFDLPQMLDRLEHVARLARRARVHGQAEQVSRHVALEHAARDETLQARRKRAGERRPDV